MRRAWLLPVVCAGLAGCGSLSAAELPPAATPVRSPAITDTPDGQVFESDIRRRDALTLGQGNITIRTLAKPPPLKATADDGATTLRLFPRARELQATGRTTGTVGVGVGPAGVVSDGRGNAYVTDPGADGVVVVRTRPSLAVTRRVGLPGGGPWAIAYDGRRHRLWVTLTKTNQLVELATGSHPRELRRYPTIRSPLGVEVTDDAIVVYGVGAFQRVTPRG